MDSILNSVKKMIGISEECTDFDIDIIMHINSVFMILCQIGIGPINGFSISDSYSKWSDFIEDNLKLEAVKSYTYLKVRMLFDPPTSSAVADAINKNIAELEWRMHVIAENNQNGGEIT